MLRDTAHSPPEALPSSSTLDRQPQRLPTENQPCLPLPLVQNTANTAPIQHEPASALSLPSPSVRRHALPANGDNSNAVFEYAPARQIWNRLSEKLDALDRNRYFSAASSEVKERSSKVQKLLLQISTETSSIPQPNSHAENTDQQLLDNCNDCGQQALTEDILGSSIDRIYATYRSTGHKRLMTPSDNTR